jgi:osmotically-inducible protein OsmY
MKTNDLLQKDVQDAIRWERALKGAEIDVNANDGIITLTGWVDSYGKKIKAEQATKSVTGVQAIIEKIIVSHGTGIEKSDEDLAKDVLNALKWNWEIPNEKVKVKVENGWITLEGETEWNYQKEAAQNTITKVEGIKGSSRQGHFSPSRSQNRT